MYTTHLNTRLRMPRARGLACTIDRRCTRRKQHSARHTGRSVTMPMVTHSALRYDTRSNANKCRDTLGGQTANKHIAWHTSSRSCSLKIICNAWGSMKVGSWVPPPTAAIHFMSCQAASLHCRLESPTFLRHHLLEGASCRLDCCSRRR